MLFGSVFFHERYHFLTVFTLFLLYFSTLLQPVAAVLKNVTIDDQKGDARTGKIPIYAPDFAWAKETCVGCAIGYDPVQLFDHTATAATFMPDKGVVSNTADFDFNGTAIYIFFTLFYNEGEGVTVNTECNFTLDKEPPVFFNHSGDPTGPQTKRDYQVLVFNKTGLEHKSHHMRISMSDVMYHVFLSFDYAQYTIDEAVDLPTSTSNLETSDVVPSPTSSQSLAGTPSLSSSPKTSKTMIGIVVGGVLGGIAVLAGFLTLFWLCCRGTNRYPKRSKPGPATSRPFIYSHRANPSQSMSSTPAAWAREPTITPSLPGANGFPSSGIPSSTQARNADIPRPSSQPTPPYPRSNLAGSIVEHRIRDTNRRMQNLTAEIASTSSQSSKTRSPSRATAELLEEVKRLRREIQVLKQSERSPLGPPPQYDE